MTKSHIAHIARIAGLAALVATSSLLIIAPASAQSIDDQSSVRVAYRDLDIDHAPGAAILQQRVEDAATSVCGGQVDNRDLGRLAELKRCRAETVERAMSQLVATKSMAAADQPDPRLTGAGR